MDTLGRLLDYHLRLDEPAAREATERLLGEDASARRVSGALERTLKVLSAWGDEAAPAGLAGRTLEYIAQTVSMGNGVTHPTGGEEHGLRTHPTLAEQEQARAMARASAAIAARRAAASREDSSDSSRRWIVHSLRDLAVVAASIMVLVLVSQPG